MKHLFLVIVSLAGCSGSEPVSSSQKAVSPLAAAERPTSPATQPAPLAARADAFLVAWRDAKRGRGPSIEALLAEHVTLRYRHAADEPGIAPQVLARADAAKRLIDTVEGFVAGERRACDARCCTLDTSFQHGDTMAAIVSICFDHDAVTEIEAQ